MAWWLVLIRKYNENKLIRIQRTIGAGAVGILVLLIRAEWKTDYMLRSYDTVFFTDESNMVCEIGTGVSLDPLTVAEPYGVVGYTSLFRAEVRQYWVTAEHDPNLKWNIVILIDSSILINTLSGLTVL